MPDNMIVNIVTITAVAVLTPLLLSLLYWLKTREERKHKNADNRTRLPKFLSVIILALAVFFFVGFVAVAIGMAIDAQPIGDIIGVCVAAVIAPSLMVTLYLFLRFRYEIVGDNGLTVVRMFGKKRKEIMYSDISYFLYAPGYMGGLVLYDEYGVPMLQLSAFSVGANMIVDKLLRNGVRQVSAPFPPSDMKTTPQYKLHKKSNIYKVLITFFSFIVVAFLVVLTICAALLRPPKAHENYAVNGTVSTIEAKTDTLTMTLQGDDSIYYINDIVFGEFDARLVNRISEGDEITLYVAYTDKRQRKNISHIEYNGMVYLNYDDALKAEEENFEVGLGLALISVGILALFACGDIVFIVMFVRLNKKKKSENKDTAVAQ